MAAKEKLLERIDEIGAALDEKGVSFDKISALAFAELAVQATAKLFGIHPLEARLRVTCAILELGRADLKNLLGEEDGSN
jgi:hypothetical protein